MATEVLKTGGEADYGDAVTRAAAILSKGGLVAFPTETVYGLGACVDKPAAVDRLRGLKSRQGDKAFTVHLGAAEKATEFVPELSLLARRFIHKVWPGPVTLVLPVDDPSKAAVMVGRNGAAAGTMYFERTIGLRCPSDRLAHALLQAVEGPVVATSANLAGNPSPQTGADVLRDLDGRIDLLLDAGRTEFSMPSTIVRVSGSSFELLREGVYDARMIERLAVLRVLFVCSGNTCRSPMAAGLAASMIAGKLGCKVADLPAKGVVVESAGVSGGAGCASNHAAAVMARRGVDLAGHISRSVTPEMLQQADYVYAMTASHRQTLLQMAPPIADRVYLLLEGDEVADPVGGTLDDYERCAQTLERGLKARLPEMLL